MADSMADENDTRPRPVLGLLDPNLQDVRDKTALEDKLRTLTAQSSLEKSLLKVLTWLHSNADG